MALADFLALLKPRSTDDHDPTAEKAQIVIDLVTEIATLVYQKSSATGIAMFERLISIGAEINVYHAPKTASVDTIDGVKYFVLDPEHGEYVGFFDSNGRIHKFDITQIVLHEFAHLAFLYQDPQFGGGDPVYGFYFDEVNGRHDYSGKPDITSFQILDELRDFGPRRLSYAGAVAISDEIGEQVFEVGADYTLGRSIDVAVVRDFRINTSTNPVSSDDLLVGTMWDNEHISGDGFDFLHGMGGADVLAAGAGTDYLYHTDVSLFEDNAADILIGGDGYDTYYVGDGDIIIDGGTLPEDLFDDFDGVPEINLGSTGKGDGRVFLGNELLTGGVLPGAGGCGATNDQTSDGESVWTNPVSGEVYRLSDGNLIVELDGASVTIRDWSNGDLGITLSGESPSDGDCPPDDFGSPLVLDLDGNGIELTRLENSVAFFDIDNDGIRERTSWVGPGDGLLALDRNANGKIDNGAELFGYGSTFSGGASWILPAQTGGFFEPKPIGLSGPGDLEHKYQSGFELLSELDTSGDGFITSSDQDYDDLRIWRDLNQDGTSAADELLSLADLGIQSIDLNGQSVFREQAGSIITDTSVFSFANGDQGEIADVWFRFNQFDTRVAPVPNLDASIAALPNLSAGGSVGPLHNAMAGNPDLQVLVTKFANLEIEDLGRVPGLISAILFEWADVDDIHFESRGRFSDARAVAVMEAFADTPFSQWSGTNPRPFAGAELAEQFAAVAQNFAAQLIAQSNLGQALFPELAHAHGKFLTLNEAVSGADLLQRLANNLPTNTIDALAFLKAGISLFDMVYLSFDDVVAVGDSGVAYRTAVEALIQSAGLDLRYEELLNAQIGGSGVELFLTRSVSPSGSLHVVPVVAGGEGDDEIVLGGGAQIIYWGMDQGSDTIDLNPFEQQKYFITPRASVYMEGLVRSDVAFDIAKFWNGRELEVRIIATGETLVLGNAAGAAAELIFADGDRMSSQDLADVIAGIVAQSTTGNETLFQYIENIELDGGDGDDILIGRSGDSTYRFDVGGGNDIIRDDGVGRNSVTLGAVVSPTDVEFSRTGRFLEDLVITIISTGETLTVTKQFARGGPVLDQLLFEADGSVLSSEEIAQLFTVQDEGDNLIIGSANDDRFVLGEGSDEIKGLNGSDEYHIFAWQLNGSSLIDDLGWYGDDTVFFGSYVSTDHLSYSASIFTYTNPDTNGAVAITDSIEYFVIGGDRYTKDQLATLLEVRDRGGVAGTLGDDTFTGTEENDDYSGLAGRDTIEGFGGHDVLDGGGNDDIISGGDGDDFITGGNGSDILEGGDGNDEIHANYDRYSGGWYDYVGDTLRGEDGEDYLHGNAGSDELYGGDGRDLLLGDSGDDLYEGGTGDDFFSDNDGSDTYKYQLGDGNDVILENTRDDWEPNYLELGDQISRDDVSFSFAVFDLTRLHESYNSSDFRIGISAEFADGGSVTIASYWFNDPIHSHFSFKFADGSVVDLSAVAAEMRLPSADDQIIAGETRSSDDVFNGGPGDDTYLTNTLGDQSFVFGIGDGQDTVKISSVGGDNVLLLQSGISAGDLSFSRGDSDQDLIVTLASGDSIKFEGNYGKWGYPDTPEYGFYCDYGYSRGIEAVDWSFLREIRFADSPNASLSVEDVLTAMLQQTDGADIVYGTEGDDLISSSAGNDVLRGSRGKDTYQFGIGSGSDIIDERDVPYAINVDGGDRFETAVRPNLSGYREIDTLYFLDNLTLDHLRFSITGHNDMDLLIEIKDSGDQLLIKNQFKDGNYGLATQSLVYTEKYIHVYCDDENITYVDQGEFYLGGYEDTEITPEVWAERFAARSGDAYNFASGIEEFVLADNTVLSRDDINALLSGRDFTISTDYRGGVLDGGDGFDRLEGGRGDDTYILGIGYLEDVARDDGGFDRVEFGADIDFSIIAFTRVGEDSNDLLIEIGGRERSALIIEDQFAGGDGAIEAFKTQDGTEYTAFEIQDVLLNLASTSGDDTIIGYNTNDIIVAKAGDDTVEARSGDDMIDGGDGRDIAVFSGSRSDYSVTEDGDFTIVEDLRGLEGTDRLINVEILRFELDSEDTPPEDEVLVPETPSDPYADYVQGTEGDDETGGSIINGNSVYGRGGNDNMLGGWTHDRLAGGDGNDFIRGLGGDDLLEGNDGDDRIYGADGADMLRGGTGNDLLSGGIGADTFYFARGDGMDSIIDFQQDRSRQFDAAHGDLLALDIVGIDDFEDMMQFAQQIDDDVVLDFGGGDVVLLVATQLAALDADMFTYV
ncbi:MAG: calcium-binding protein [Pseudomonadota bacterium]